jgi:glycosyltransferase involved in cell wall biosynthesis
MYNESRYIGKCLESLLEQTEKNLEIILVDDCSKDNTVKIVKSYQKKHKNITLLQQNHGGPGKARNLGASKAKGSILIFVDSDMVFERDYIKNLIAPILKKEEIGTTHGKELVGNIDNIWAKCWSINRIPSHGKYSGVFRAITKEAFLKSGGFDPKKGYFDDDLGKVGKALFVDEAVCYHNNPETLAEAFKHCIWVGKSFVQDKAALKSYLLKYVMFMIIAIALFAASIYYAISNLGIKACGYYLPIIAILIGIFGAYYISIARAIKDKEARYLIFMPILLIVKFSGYIVGLVKGVIKW